MPRVTMRKHGLVVRAVGHLDRSQFCKTVAEAIWAVASTKTNRFAIITPHDFSCRFLRVQLKLPEQFELGSQHIGRRVVGRPQILASNMSMCCFRPWQPLSQSFRVKRHQMPPGSRTVGRAKTCRRPGVPDRRSRLEIDQPEFLEEAADEARERAEVGTDLLLYGTPGVQGKPYGASLRSRAAE